MVNLWLRWFNYGKHAFGVLFVVKPWLICGYGGLTMVNMLFWFYLWLRWFNYGKHAFLVLFVVKSWLICGYGGLTTVNMLFWFYL